MKDDAITTTTTLLKQSGSGNSGCFPRTGAVVPVGDGGMSMGPLEAEQYEKLWRRSYRFRRTLPPAGATAPSGHELGALRDTAQDDDEEEDVSHLKQSASAPESNPVAPDEIVARLLFARLFDGRPGLLRSIRSAAPTVVIDVADVVMLDHVATIWHEVLYSEKSSLMDVAADKIRRRIRPDALYLVVKEPPKNNAKTSSEIRSLTALSLALPFFVLSPLATTHGSSSQAGSERNFCFLATRMARGADRTRIWTRPRA